MAKFSIPLQADVAADAGLYVEFSDKALQDRYSQRREAAQAGRDYFTKSRAASSPSATSQSRPRSANASSRRRSQTTAEGVNRPARLPWENELMSKRVLT